MENTIKDGGPVFPFQHEMFDPKTANKYIESNKGMSLRDYFAAHAPINRFYNHVEHGNYSNMKAVSEVAYQWADAMIKARGDQ